MIIARVPGKTTSVESVGYWAFTLMQASVLGITFKNSLFAPDFVRFSPEIIILYFFYLI